MTASRSPIRLLDRAALLGQVESALVKTGRVALSPPERVQTPYGWGLTRMGEELAAKAPGSRRVLHLSAGSDVEWFQGLLRVASQLQLRARFLRSPRDPFLGVRKWLREHSDWLLIVDDVNDADRIAEFLSPIERGQIVLLLRSPKSLPENWAEVHRINELSDASAEDFLLLAAGRSNKESKDSVWLKAITQALHRNPGLLQAAGELIRRGISLPQLADQFSVASSSAAEAGSQIGNVLCKLAQRAAPNQQLQFDCLAWLRSVPTTESLAPLLPVIVREQFRREQLEASGNPRLQRVCEELTKADVGTWTDVNRAQADSLAAALIDQELTAGPFAAVIRGSIESSRRIGAWERGAELGQRWIQRVKNDPKRSSELADGYLLAARCLLIGERFAVARRNLRFGLENLGQRYEAAADALMDIVEIDLNENRIDTAAQRLEQVGKLHARAEIDGIDPSRARRLFLRGAVLVAQRKYSDAVRVLQRCLALRANLLPNDHPDVLKNLSLLGRAAFAVPDLKLAEQLVRQDLQIRRESAEVTEGEVSIPAHALADLLYSQGHYREAENLYEEVLQLREKLYSPDDHRISETLSRLAVLRSARGAYRDAEPLFRRAIQMTENLYGERHPVVARVLNELAESLFAQGKYDQCRRILERAMRIQESALRANDPAMGRTRNNLAALHVAIGQFETAQRLYEQDLAIKRKTLPAVHPWIATTLNNLGEVLQSRGEVSEAEPLLQEALKIREEVHGPQHPQVAQSLTNLGYVYLLQHRLMAARELFERALAVREVTLNPMHPHRASSLTCLAQTMQLLGDLENARQKYGQAMEIATSVYGAEHAQTTQLMTRIGRLDLHMGHRARAELSLLKAKLIQEKTLGPNHRLFGETLIGLGEVYQQEGKHEQAFPLLERGLIILRETTQGSRYDIAETLLLLGKNLKARGVLKEAHERLKECYEILTSLLEAEHPQLVECGDLLGELAIQHGDPIQAESLLAAALTRAEHSGDGARQLMLVPLLADAHARLKKFDLAESILLQHQTLVTKNFGAEARELIPALSHLAGVKYLQNKFTEAVPLIQQCVRLSERHNGGSHAETAKHLENLAGVLFLQERYEEAEPLIERAVNILKDRFGPNAPVVQAAMENYSQLLKQTNRSREAQSIDDELDESRGLESHVLDDLF